MLGVSGRFAATNPIRGIFAGCCASALAPHAMSTTTIAKTLAHFRYFDIAQYRFWILDFRLSEKESGHRIQVLLFMLFSLIENRQSKIRNYLITLSAPANMLGEMVRPICFAAFKLITNSNFFGCSTGSSAGLAPFRILST